MAFSHNPPKIIPLWMLLSSLIILWDAGFVLFRPRSMPGGDLHAIWKPYALYGTIDLVYSRQAFEENDGFPGALAFLNIIESALNFTYLAFWARGDGAAAVFVGLVSMVMTIGKTMLYFSVEYFSGWGGIGHNDMATLMPLYIVPNSLWIIFPSYCIFQFGREIITGLKGKKIGGGTVGVKKKL